MLAILIYVLVLWGVIALAWLVAWWLKRRGAAMSGQFTNIVLFVGFLFGFLLTTLQVFATNHYSDARSQAQSEPTSLVTMYDDLGVFPPRVRTTGHRVIICYMWSVAEGDWKAQEREEGQESPDTVVWGDRLRNFRNTLPQASPATSQVGADLSNADSTRQQLLFLARPQIPAILWVIVFVSSGLLFFLQVSDSQEQRKIIRRTVLTAVTVLMTVEVASLAVLDRPFSPIARIQPSAMTDAIALLEAGRPGGPTEHDCGLSATTSSYRVRTHAGSPSGTTDRPARSGPETPHNAWLLVTTVRRQAVTDGRSQLAHHEDLAEMEAGTRNTGAHLRRLLPSGKGRLTS